MNNKVQFLYSFKFRTLVVFLALYFVMGSLMVYYHLDNVRKEEYKKIRHQLLFEGRNFLNNIRHLDLEKIHQINQPRDKIIDDSSYKEGIKELLDYSGKFKIPENLIYTMVRIKDDQYYFILINNVKYSLEKDNPFKISKEVRPYFDKAYQTKEIQFPGVYSDKIGTWLTVVIPMIGEDGEVYAIHEPARTIDYVNDLVYQEMLKSGAIPLLIFIIGTIVAYLLITFLFNPFYRIVEYFKGSHKDEEDGGIKELDQLKVRGEFGVLRDTLKDYLIKRIKESQKEIQNIMSSLKEGLFLVKRNLTIGTEFSLATETIFGLEEIAGVNFIDLMKDMVSVEDQEAIKDYIELLFKNEVNQDVLDDLNPLKKIQVSVKEGANYQKKYLNFYFKRVLNVSEVDLLMVSVNDITENVLLENKILSDQEQAKEEMEKIFNILRVDYSLLADFIVDTEKDIQAINEVLKLDKLNIQEKINEIYRLIHTIKGNSSILDIGFITNKAHEFENKIIELRNKSKEELKNDDLLGFVLFLSSLQDNLKDIRNIVKRIASFNKSVSQVSNKVLILIKTLTDTANSMGNRLNKPVELFVDDFDEDQVSSLNRKYSKICKDILVQLLRNSISHGIESQEERLKKNKNTTGQIHVSSSIKEDKLTIIFRDDGKGIDIDKIKTKLEQNHSLEKINSMTNEQLVDFIFQPSFSTADKDTVDAGRGIGLDIVKSRIEEIKGEISVEFETDKYTQFIITLPTT